MMVVKLVRVGALGALVFHPSHFAHFCCRSAVEVATVAVITSGRSQPEPQPASVEYVSVAPPKPMRMAGSNYSFTLPGGWSKDEASVGYVYRDPQRHHAVRIRVEASDESSQAWVERQFPDASETWGRSLGTKSATFARKIGKTLRILAAVVAEGGVVYELACSTDELDSADADAVCESVLATFRVGE